MVLNGPPCICRCAQAERADLMGEVAVIGRAVIGRIRFEAGLCCHGLDRSAAALIVAAKDGSCSFAPQCMKVDCAVLT